MKRFINISILLALLFSFAPLYAQNTANYDYSTVSPSFQFTRDLGQGNSGQDVSYLQCILGISPSGYFGTVTAGLLTRFQNNHAEAVLTPVGLSAGTGYFGSSTRNYVNQQVAADGSPDATCGVGITGNASINQNNGAGSTNTQASTQATCPVGYVCTQHSTQPVSCPVGYMCAPNPQSQQNSLASTLSLIPYLVSQPGGGQRLVYPSQSGSGASGQNGNSSQPGGNNAISSFGGSTSIGQPVQPYQNPTDYQTPGIAPNPFGTGTQTGGSSAASQSIDFSGVIKYNSTQHSDASRPCNGSNPNEVSWIMNDNAYNSKTTGPLYLLLNLDPSLGPVSKVIGSAPNEETCAIGKYLPNTNKQYQGICQNLKPASEGGGTMTSSAEINGLITEIEVYYPGSDGKCKAN